MPKIRERSRFSLNFKQYGAPENTQIVDDFDIFKESRCSYSSFHSFTSQNHEKTVVRQKTYKNEGGENRRISSFVEKHSSFDAYEAERIPEI